jgi:hypothetical protein
MASRAADRAADRAAKRRKKANEFVASCNGTQGNLFVPAEDDDVFEVEKIVGIRFHTPAWVDGLLYSIGRSPDSVDHEPPHEDTKIHFLRIQPRGKMDFPHINKVDI